MVPFRTRFSPCEMARTADAQRLIGCLYTPRYCYIPMCRFSRHRSVSAWLLFPIFFNTERTSGLPAFQAFSPCTSRTHLMVGLPSLLYP